MSKTRVTTKELLEQFVSLEEKHDLEHKNLEEKVDHILDKIDVLSTNKVIEEIKADVSKLSDEVGYIKGEIKKVKSSVDDLTAQTLTSRESLRNLTDDNTRRLNEIENNKNFKKDKSANIVVGVAVFVITAIIAFFITKNE